MDVLLKNPKFDIVELDLLGVNGEVQRYAVEHGILLPRLYKVKFSGTAEELEAVMGPIKLRLSIEAMEGTEMLIQTFGSMAVSLYDVKKPFQLNSELDKRVAELKDRIPTIQSKL
eukprot:ANDGO_04988.mRNA.1 hypothetical protein